MTEGPQGTGGGGGKGSLEPTRPASLVGWAVAGLGLGLLLRPVAERIDTTAPTVTWAQPLGLVLVTAILAGTAWSTWRTVHVRRERLDPHRAVNRLVLARACAYAGAFFGGGYLGYAVAWVGDPSPLADERITRAGVAFAAGALMVVASLLLERACRVRKDDRHN